MDRQNYPTYAKIRLMRGKIKGFGTIVPEILCEICEDPTYARSTVLRLALAGRKEMGDRPESCS